MPVAEPAPRYDPRRHRRRSIRLPDHDYAGGVYFVTICTHGRLHLFGDVVDGAMILNAAGETVWAECERSEALRTEVTLDAFVAMPNHVHGIIHIAGDASTDGVGATGRSPLQCGPNARPGLPPKSLGAFVAGFKSAVTKRIYVMRGTPGGAVWQRNYFERVIRAARALHVARRYVRDNPARWHRDRCHLGRR